MVILRILEDKNIIFDSPVILNFNNVVKIIKAKVKGRISKWCSIILNPKDKVVRHYYVGICAIFKNEACYLTEWLEYHRTIGVEHFWLYNNFSGDDYKSVLEPYIQNDIVTLIEWPRKQGQVSAYEHCIKNFRFEAQWIGFIDLDEFVVPIKCNKINNYLKQYERKCGSIYIYWKMFGSSGKERRENGGLVIEDFVVCWEKLTAIGKSFWNTKYEYDFSHKTSLPHEVWTTEKGIHLPPINQFGNAIGSEINFVREYKVDIQINHYFSKTYEEYKKKYSRGDAIFKKNPRDYKYFRMHELHNISSNYAIYKYIIEVKKRIKKISE